MEKKKIVGVSLVLAGIFLLVAWFFVDHLSTNQGLATGMLIAGGVLLLCSLPLMWQTGIQNLQKKQNKIPALLRMRQSGFFDILIVLTALALVLAVLGTIGYISYNNTLKEHIGLAYKGDSASMPTTLAEAKKLPDFIEYNFKQSLGFLAQGYGSFLAIAAMFAAMVVVCALYMRFISPIVQADEQLQKAHGIYRTVAQYAGAIFVTLIILFPIYWMIISSLKTSQELLQTVPTLWPQNFQWVNYPNVLKRAPFLRYLLNTLVTTAAIMAGQLTIGVLAAYGFSKGEFIGKNALFTGVLGALMVPIQVTFVPIYVLISRLGLIDTYGGIILPGLVSAYFIFMLRQTFMSVDNSYLEAGKVDGMGRLGSIIYVLCPMCKPTLITISIISFIDGWNSYFWPKMVSKTEFSRTIAVGVQQLRNTFAGQEVSNYNEIMAGAVMAIVPIIILFVVLQKYIMTGMSKAAMK